VAEGSQRRAIDGLQIVEQRLARGNEIGPSIAGDAGARVEREDVHRHVGSVDDVDRLWHALVPTFEVLRGQTAHRLRPSVTSTSTRTPSVRDENVCF
jgi:hypothetical protein